LLLNYCNYTTNNTTVSYNQATTGNGGGFLIWYNVADAIGQYSSTITATGTNIVGSNIANDGGGMCISAGQNINTENFTITKNQANVNGGGLYIGGVGDLGGPAEVTTGPNTVISYNTATNGGGYFIAL